MNLYIFYRNSNNKFLQFRLFACSSPLFSKSESALNNQSIHLLSLLIKSWLNLTSIQIYFQFQYKLSWMFYRHVAFVVSIYMYLLCCNSKNNYLNNNNNKWLSLLIDGVLSGIVKAISCLPHSYYLGQLLYYLFKYSIGSNHQDR